MVYSIATITLYVVASLVMQTLNREHEGAKFIMAIQGILLAGIIGSVIMQKRDRQAFVTMKRLELIIGEQAILFDNLTDGTLIYRNETERRRESEEKDVRVAKVNQEEEKENSCVACCLRFFGCGPSPV